MEILQLRYFVEVAKTMNITRAAKNIHISQPSLSNSIIRLENELEQPLFYREKGKLTLTPYGNFFLGISKNILDQINLSKRPFVSKTRSMISITMQSFNDRFLKLCNLYITLNPYVEFNIDCKVLATSLSTDSYDFVLANSNFLENPPPNFVTISESHSYVAIPSKHRLAKLDIIPIEELHDEMFCFVRDENGNYESIYNVCVEAGFIPHTVLTTNNQSVKAEIISNGDVIGFISQGWISVFKRFNNISVIPVKANNPYSHDTRLYWNDELNHVPEKIAFANFCGSGINTGIVDE